MDRLELLFDESSQEERTHDEIAERRELLSISAKLAMLFELDEVPEQHVYEPKNPNGADKEVSESSSHPREFNFIGLYSYFAELLSWDSDNAWVYYGQSNRLFVRLGEHIQTPADGEIGMFSVGERYVRFRRVGTGIEIVQII